MIQVQNEQNDVEQNIEDQNLSHQSIVDDNYNPNISRHSVGNENYGPPASSPSLSPPPSPIYLPDEVNDQNESLLNASMGANDFADDVLPPNVDDVLPPNKKHAMTQTELNEMSTQTCK